MKVVNRKKTLLKWDAKPTFRKLMTVGYESNRKKEKEELEHLGYHKDESLSQKKNKVYVHNKTGKAYVVYNGTNPTDVRDLATDAAIAVGLGRLTPRFKQAKRLAKRAKEKYGEDHTAAIGHSLGGALATESGLKERITFNKAVGIGGIGKRLRRGQVDYRTSGDAVSLLSKTSRYGNRTPSKDAGTYHETLASSSINPLTNHTLTTLR